MLLAILLLSAAFVFNSLVNIGQSRKIRTMQRILDLHINLDLIKQRQMVDIFEAIATEKHEQENPKQ